MTNTDITFSYYLEPVFIGSKIIVGVDLYGNALRLKSVKSNMSHVVFKAEFWEDQCYVHYHTGVDSTQWKMIRKYT